MDHRVYILKHLIGVVNENENTWK